MTHLRPTSEQFDYIGPAHWSDDEEAWELDRREDGRHEALERIKERNERSFWRKCSAGRCPEYYDPQEDKVHITIRRTDCPHNQSVLRDLRREHATRRTGVSHQEEIS